MLKLQEKSLKWALKNIQKNYDTYVFPMPFEYEAINACQDEVISHLRGIDILNEGIREYRTALTPKSTLGFRICTQLDPLDSIVSNAIIYEIADEIERARVPKSQEQVFSFRLLPQDDGTMYDPNYDWNSYLTKANKIIENGDYSHVLVTDISDFYPSIYLHNIETSLFEAVKASGKSCHVQVLINYLKAMHLNQTHKGIPVGPQFSRPIAELILDEIDRQLISNGIYFIRFVDDYLLFAKSETEAYINLAFLAQLLYDNRNLKLNEKKTEILTTELFKTKYLKKITDVERESIIDNLNDLLEEMGISPDPYEDINLDDLDDANLEKIKALNLELILSKELEKKDPDSFIISFLIANFARIDNTDVAEVILDDRNICKLFPKLRTIINYLERVRSFSSKQKHEIGERVLNLVTSSFVGQLEFNRIWFLNLFSKSTEWDNETRFEEMLKQYNDSPTRRELLLALGRSSNIKYFRANKSSSLDVNSWTRRAFIAGISCLPESERIPWFKARSLRSRDILDRIVEKWVEKNHF